MITLKCMKLWGLSLFSKKHMVTSIYHPNYRSVCFSRVRDQAIDSHTDQETFDISAISKFTLVSAAHF